MMMIGFLTVEQQIVELIPTLCHPSFTLALHVLTNSGPLQQGAQSSPLLANAD
jgi:hypothetical protein